MKVFLISHVADADGVTPVILTDLAFSDYDYRLFEVTDLESFLLEKINTDFFDEYDKVFITDLCFGEDIAELICQTPLKDKLQVLDHHVSRIPMNKYEFITVVDEENGRKESGTSLYYRYLRQHYNNELLRKKCVYELVDLVRSADTWEWKKTNNLAARDIGTILSYYGNDRYIEKYKKFLRENDAFYYDDTDILLIDIDRKNVEDYIENCKSKVIFDEIMGYRVGIVFAELYRSELGNELAEYYKDRVDFIMIINMNRSISFRCVKDNINLGEIAHTIGGYGHMKASGAPLPEGIKEYTIEYVLRGFNNGNRNNYSR